MPEKPDLARNHLANERTFLAWVRTGIGVVVFGFAIGRFGIALREFFQLQGHATRTTGLSVWFGMASIALGVLLVLAGLMRYHNTRRQIEEDQFKPAGALVNVVGVLTALVSIGLAVYLMIILSRVP
jgi:putative membrane protein